MEGDRAGGVIICRGKLQPSVMFVLRRTWQNGGLIRFNEKEKKKKQADPFPRHHHVRLFEILRVLFFPFFFNQSWEEMNRSFSCDPSPEV